MTAPRPSRLKGGDRESVDFVVRPPPATRAQSVVDPTNRGATGRGREPHAVHPPASGYYILLAHGKPRMLGSRRHPPCESPSEGELRCLVVSSPRSPCRLCLLFPAPTGPNHERIADGRGPLRREQRR